MDNLHWTEINGVTTIWTEAPDPLRATLMFRTGQADETLITAGCTHLIEHMVLTEMGDLNQNSNGFVASSFTGFSTMGHPDDICTFFRKVCEGLASLPGGRLEAEKKILLAEAAGRRYNVSDSLLVWRFGATGYGLVGLPELGIRGAMMEQLQTWGNQRFTRENAILWLSGGIPSDLRLDLLPGEKRSMPQLAPIQETFPAWFVDDRSGGVAASAVVPRLAAGMIFNGIAAKRMQEALRNKYAVSYSPTIFYDPLNADSAHLVLFADSEQDRRAELARAFGEVFEKLATVDESEVEAARKLYLDQLTGPLAPPLADQLLIDTWRAAMAWLFGEPYETRAQLEEDVYSINADKVQSFAQVVRNNVIFAVPGKTIIAPWMGKRAPISSGKVVEGREILQIDTPIKTERMVVGSEGVSIKFDSGTHLTVRYANLVAALQHDDGGLCIIGSDSTWLWVEPTLWRNGARICEEIRGKIPMQLIIDQDPRDINAIPKPTTTAWQRFRATLSVVTRPEERPARTMGKFTKFIAYFLLGLRAIFDLVQGGILYQRFGDRGQIGFIFYSYIFYLYLFMKIKNESMYGGRFAHSRNPIIYWSILLFLVLIHLCLMWWIVGKIFTQ